MAAYHFISPIGRVDTQLWLTQVTPGEAIRGKTIRNNAMADDLYRRIKTRFGLNVVLGYYDQECRAKINQLSEGLTLYIWPDEAAAKFFGISDLMTCPSMPPEFHKPEIHPEIYELFYKVAAEHGCTLHPDSGKWRAQFCAEKLQLTGHIHMSMLNFAWYCRTDVILMARDQFKQRFKQLQRKFSVSFYPFYQPYQHVVLFSTRYELEKAEADGDLVGLKEQMYAITKKYDIFGVITEENYQPVIACRDDYSGDELFGMAWEFC